MRARRQRSFQGRITNRFPLTRTDTATETRLVGTVGKQPDVFVTAHTSNAEVVIPPVE